MTSEQNTQMWKKCICFSDGASSQYKHCKNFINLCHHNSDHGLQAEWNFFAFSQKAHVMA